MKLSRMGIHFEYCNAFWKDLFFFVAYARSNPRGHWKNRGPKLFFRQIINAYENWRNKT